jgi:hypothetical protein
MEHDEKKGTSGNNEVDPFTTFMFGRPRLNDEKTNEDKEPKSFSRDDWIFGRNHRSHTKAKADEDHQITALLNNFFNQVNTEEVMKNIDLFIESAKEFKPIWGKIYPYIQKWMK